MIDQELPPKIKEIVGSEKIYFAVRSENKTLARLKILFMIFPFIWTIILLIVIITESFSSSVPDGTDAIINNGIISYAKEYIADNLFLIMLFLTAGLFMEYKAIKLIFGTGELFVATDSRLIRYINNKIISYNWKEFKEDIKIKTYWTKDGTQAGDISLKLKNYHPQDMPKIRINGMDDINTIKNIRIYGVQNPHNIENIIRKRIKENTQDNTNVD